MKLSVLIDNRAGSRTEAEHGLSYFIEHDGKNILFDAGQSEMFLRNAAKMNVDLRKTDKIVLSHGHYDHGNGLCHIPGRALLCHPGCFKKRYSKIDRRYIGLKYSKEELSSMFDLTTTISPFEITKKIVFLGEIPRKTSFESKNTIFMFEDGSADFVPDDSALAIMLSEGLFIVTGCGHAGIVNTIEHAKNVTGMKKVAGIMGGFHLKEHDIQTRETISYLRNEAVRYVIPSHCTDLPALAAFYDAFCIRQVRTGDVLTI